MKIAALSCAAMALVAGVSRAEVVWASYSFVVTLTPGGALLSAPQAMQTIRFEGMHEVELVSVGDLPRAGGVKNNPLYKDKGVRGDNPLHKNGDRFTPGNPWASFDAEGFGWYAGTFDSSAFVQANGIIHRDLAARNILLATDQGMFGSVPGASIVLGADGIDDLRTTQSVGPIRWMAPESLRLYFNGDAASDAYFDVSMALEWAVIPSPSGAVVLAMAGLIAHRRRR
ncbi:MAG TPA: protein kinase [Phycisphaerales bacterium]